MRKSKSKSKSKIKSKSTSNSKSNCNVQFTVQLKRAVTVHPPVVNDDQDSWRGKTHLRAV